MPTFTDIQIWYTKQVTDFLNKGYYISSCTNTSRHDRFASVDLMHPEHPNEAHRVCFDFFFDYTLTEYCASIKTSKLEVTKYLEVDNYIVINEKKFYSINSSKCPNRYKCFFIDSEDLEYVIAKRKNRKDRKSYTHRNVEVNNYKLNKFSNKFIDSVMEKINKVRGFKNATAACVDNIRVTHSLNKQSGCSYVYQVKVDFSYKYKHSSICMTQRRR